MFIFRPSVARAICGTNFSSLAAGTGKVSGSTTEQVVGSLGAKAFGASRELSNLSPDKEAVTILLTGLNGRVGTSTEDALKALGVKVIGASRELYDLPLDEKIKYLKTNNIKCIINAAVLSRGTPSQLDKVNVRIPLDLAEAAKSLAALIQIDSTCSKLPEIKAKDAYATSKLIARNGLKKHNNVIFCYLDVLLGVPKLDQIDFSCMSVAGISAQVSGGPIIFQPTTYEATGAALAKIALLTTKADTRLSVPSDINIAGDPIAANDFIDLLDPKAIKVSVALEDLRPIAREVNNGTLSEEFIDLAEKSRDNPKIHPNDYYKEILGDRFPSPAKVAEETNKHANSFEKIECVTKALIGSPNTGALVGAIWNSSCVVVGRSLRSLGREIDVK